MIYKIFSVKQHKKEKNISALTMFQAIYTDINLLFV